MAKKNLASLMNGIMGENPAPDTDSQVQSPQTDSTALNEARQTRKPGRPTKSPYDRKTDEIRATFIVSDSLLRKVKYISLVEGCLLKDVVGDSLEAYIKSWEAANGTINLPDRK